MPTTLIIPDIHLRHNLVQKIIDHEKCDKVVFLGDHFDDFIDTPGQNHQSALWIKARQAQHPEDIWIWGNHDVSYAYPSQITLCSGYSELKAAAIQDVLTPDDWEKFQFHTWVGPFLCTHAGLHSSHTPGLSKDNVKDYMEMTEKNAWRCLEQRDAHWAYRAGYARYGRQPFGGLTWLDFNQEFTAIDNISQIFGHTDMYGMTARERQNSKLNCGILHTETSDNYCLDAHGLCYAVWNDVELKVKYVPDEIKNWRT